MHWAYCRPTDLFERNTTISFAKPRDQRRKAWIAQFQEACKITSLHVMSSTIQSAPTAEVPSKRREAVDSKVSCPLLYILCQSIPISPVGLWYLPVIFLSPEFSSCGLHRINWWLLRTHDSYGRLEMISSPKLANKKNGPHSAAIDSRYLPISVLH